MGENKGQILLRETDSSFLEILENTSKLQPQFNV